MFHITHFADAGPNGALVEGQPDSQHGLAEKQPLGSEQQAQVRLSSIALFSVKHVCWLECRQV